MTKTNMPKYAILRIKKISSIGNVSSSLRHSFRERETKNADCERSNENQHLGASSSEQALEKFKELLPKKVRKNAVRCVEYLVTASPGAMAEKTRYEQNNFFRDSYRWIEKKHGKENIFYAGIHRDESTPHMYAYVVPLDDRGKLNAKSFFNGRSAMSVMQTDFANKVGIPNGLERGKEWSKARHDPIKRLYHDLNQQMPDAPKLEYTVETVKKGLFVDAEKTVEKSVKKFWNEQVPYLKEVEQIAYSLPMIKQDAKNEIEASNSEKERYENRLDITNDLLEKLRLQVIEDPKKAKESILDQQEKARSKNREKDLGWEW